MAILCGICGEDIATELGEKSARGPKGDEFHLDCVLRAKRVTEELIERIVFKKEED